MTKEEDTLMNAGWQRALVATAFIVTLVALGALEVLTARLPLDQSVAGPANDGSEPLRSWQDVLNEHGQLLSLEAGPAPLGEGDEGRRADGQFVEARGGQFIR